jgi:phospholipid-binding lipoprotein MlaA
VLLLYVPAPTALADEGDPWEGFNRGVWWFDDKLDRYLLEPIGVGWRFITPTVVRTRLRNVFQNIGFPLRFVNDLLQGDVKQAGRETGRFLMNTTVGVAGIFDPASRYGLEMREEDFGQTLGVWGVPPGAYVVLPFLGPSGVRDATMLPLDLLAGAWPALISPTANSVISATNLVNTRALSIEDIREARAASLDYYVAVRNFYRQRRAALVQNGELPAEEIGDELYEIDEEDDD